MCSSAVYCSFPFTFGYFDLVPLTVPRVAYLACVQKLDGNIRRSQPLDIEVKKIMVTIGTGGDWSPNFLVWGTNNVLVPQLLGRSFQKARNFTASIHQNAGFSIWVFKSFPGVILSDPHSGRGRPPPAPNIQPGLWRSKAWREYPAWSTTRHQS